MADNDSTNLPGVVWSDSATKLNPDAETEPKSPSVASEDPSPIPGVVWSSPAREDTPSRPESGQGGTPASQDQPKHITSFGGYLDDVGQRFSAAWNDPTTHGVGKAWELANTPLIGKDALAGLERGVGLDPDDKDSILSGALRGTNQLLEGFSSPLQLALIVGTYGESGLIESGGAAALKAAGWDETAIRGFTDAAKTVTKLAGEGHGEGAVLTKYAQLGGDVDRYLSGTKVLEDAGLTAKALLQKAVPRRLAALALRQAGADVGTAEKVGEFAQAATNLGFTIPAAYGASVYIPRAFDDIMQGDYGAAAEHAAEGFGSAAFAGLGAVAGYHDTEGLRTELKYKLGLETRPTESVLTVRKLWDTLMGGDEKSNSDPDKARGLVAIMRGAKIDEKNMLAEFGLNHDEGWLARFFVNAGKDPEELLKWRNLVARAIGEPEVSPEEYRSVAGLPMRAEGSKDLVQGSEAYIKQEKHDPGPRTVVDADPRAHEIADAYQAMPHDPADPRVKESYDALKEDVSRQWEHATGVMGIKLEPSAQTPYRNGAEMAADVRDNHRLRFAAASGLPTDHPLAEIDPKTGHPYGDMLRGVHNLFGHAAEGFESGPTGEENAWNAHRRMFSEAALPAFTTETKGRNSWENSGSHLRDLNGEIPNPGERGYVPPQNRPPAVHKAGLLPEEFWRREDGTVANQSKEEAPGTQEFHKWFGDSKVVDDDGKPMVMYHGTASAGFSRFDTYGNLGLMGQGAYFTENPEIASEYANKGAKGMQRRGEDPRKAVYPVYLNIKNPMDMDATADLAQWNKVLVRESDRQISKSDIPGNPTNEQVYRSLQDEMAQEGYPDYDSAAEMLTWIEGMGHDGLTHKGGGRVNPDGPRHRVWIAFQPEQIKSSIGNRGTFDPKDADILHSDRRGFSDYPNNHVAYERRSFPVDAGDPKGKQVDGGVVTIGASATRIMRSVGAGHGWGALNIPAANIPEYASRLDLRIKNPQKYGLSDYSVQVAAKLRDALTEAAKDPETGRNGLVMTRRESHLPHEFFHSGQRTLSDNIQEHVDHGFFLNHPDVKEALGMLPRKIRNSDPQTQAVEIPTYVLHDANSYLPNLSPEARVRILDHYLKALEMRHGDLAAHDVDGFGGKMYNDLKRAIGGQENAKGETGLPSGGEVSGAGGEGKPVFGSGAREGPAKAQGPADATGDKRSADQLGELARRTDHEKAIAEQRMLKSGQYSKEELQKLLWRLDPRNLNDRVHSASKVLSDYTNQTLQWAQQEGLMEHGAKGYMTQVWSRPNAETNELEHEANGASGFSTQTNMTRRRVYQNAIDGILQGEKLREDLGPSALAAENRAQILRSISIRRFIDDLRTSGARASDGRPMVAFSGETSKVGGKDGENPALLVNPAVARNPFISKAELGRMTQDGRLDRFLSDGTVHKVGTNPETGEDSYAFNSHGYQSMDHPAFRKWILAAHDSAKNPVFLNSDVKAHPEIAPYLEKLIGKDSTGFLNKGVGKIVGDVAREAKGLLLFGSPFHSMQLMLRGMMMGIMPFHSWNFDPRTDVVLRKGIRGGLGLGSDPLNQSLFDRDQMAGHSHVINKIPLLREIQSFNTEFTFNKLLPALKAEGFKKMYSEYKTTYPDWTDEKVAETAADHVNNAFGGINYKRLGRVAGTQDWFRLTALAPDWLESEVRFMSSMLGGDGKVARAQVVKTAAALWITARILNYVNTGNFHGEAPFGLAVKGDDGKDKVYSVRTLPTDMLHAASDPVGFMSGRASPLLRATATAVTGRDEYGRKLPAHNMAVNLLRSSVPIPLQDPVREVLGDQPDLNWKDSLAKGVGLTVRPYHTQAGKKAAELASDQSSTGPVAPDQLLRHQAVIHFEDQLRAGNLKMEDIARMTEPPNQQLSSEEAKMIHKNFQVTKEMSPEMARLYIRAKRLPADKMLQVFDLATNEEKHLLSKVLVEKRKAWYKHVKDDMTPEERMKDPTYLRLREMFPATIPE